MDDLSDAERAELEQVDDEEEMQTLGVSAMIGEAGFTTSERRTIRPTLEVVGVWGGFQDEGIKTVLPSEAHAKIAFRLVSRQDPDQGTCVARSINCILDAFVLKKNVA